MSRWTWIPGALQVEDALLFIWLVLVTPLLQFLLGGALRGLNLGNIHHGIPNDLVLGIVFLVSTLLALVCTFTRAPGDRKGASWNTDTPFGYAHLPMIAATGIILFLGLDLLGFGDASTGLICVLFGAFVLIGLVYSHMPVINFSVRRMLMTPFIILTTTIFASTVSLIFANVNANSVVAIVQNELGRFEFELVLAGAFVYYLMFVFAPRQIAGSGGGWLQWTARFVLYMVGLILNIGLLQAV